MKITDIKLNEENPRYIKDDRMEKLVTSIKAFPKMMELRPIIVDESGVILGGNMRYRALVDLEYKEIPAAWVKRAKDLTEEQKKEFIIKDNINFGMWDMETLANEWPDVTLDEWGLDIDWNVPDEQAEEDNFEIPEKIETDIVLGDLYQIGEHRLLCGDSTDLSQLEKLMGGEKADICFTSTPYNANAVMITHEKGGRKVTPFYNNNETDNKSLKDYTKFLSDVLNNMLHITDGFIFWNIGYNANVRFAWVENTYEFREYLKEVIVWKKSAAMPIPRGLTRIYEFIFLYSEKGSQKHINKLYETASNYWEVSNISASIDNHKACFPVELVGTALNINKDNKLLVDPFIGSGTAMVAAHQLKRKCYGMELDPVYCQIIINRMKAFDPNIEVKKL